MRLVKARVQNYRSIIDTGEFEVEKLKTILVGPNEAGKTVLLQALQQLNKPNDVNDFDPLRDYPRSKYNDITTGRIDPTEVTVVTGYFELDDVDKKLIPTAYHQCQYKRLKKLNNTVCHALMSAPDVVCYRDIKKSLLRMTSHMDKSYVTEDGSLSPSEALNSLSSDWTDSTKIEGDLVSIIEKWLNDHYQYVEEGNEVEENRHAELLDKIKENLKREEVLKILDQRVPVFILFNNYFKVKPTIHLGHLAQRVEKNILDDEYYDYGNLCLLKLLGFTAKELSELGNTPSPNISDTNALKAYKDRLDSRSYQLNAASVRLTNEIKLVWMPNPKRPEADRLKVVADGQYLKVVVEDDLGVDIELDQRSEGFQWLVSFFIVFFSEAMDKHENAILLLDEPGMSLHALKQRDFRETISRLAENNQTLFTTHSPFLVGPDELDIVRVVEMKERTLGTKVHTTLSSEDPAGLLPLQEALGYDLANSLFSQQRNLILEGLTDYWYIEATAQLMNESLPNKLNDKIALVFANTAGKVVYYATILHAHNLKVAALLDSDSAGDQAAQQETLVSTLGNKNILRTKDYCSIAKAEIEDLLRDTLTLVAKDTFGTDVSEIVSTQKDRPIVSIFNAEIEQFSKYRLAKAYVRWTRENDSSALSDKEREQWTKLIEKINHLLK
ncbi:ATP-binding protein [Vibrio anguillarum]|nr:AAA family ATPase [Vibrio anguillarum]MBF4232040.1 OLD family endonuclease [Vibrio anguillarum]MBF4282797.1 OLD family endonuclease [Vibrio anguillarum]MBF4288868.1 OLD family endonuclease [Vibrio anguillarum]MBF4341148.1 OLD family endonuclease [Vibrio anguillarum]MBF4356114.1 OLD family endonuclease [Vibrio anguillarum]